MALLEFSILIPTFDRPGCLSTCLESLSRLDFDRSRWEAIFVDDGSATPAIDAVNAAAAQGLPVRMLLNPHQGPAAARNAAAAAARGRYLAFTDDDCCPDPSWLTALHACFEAHPGPCAVGGRTVNGVQDNIYSEASQLLLDYIYSRFNAVPGRARLLISNNFALPADLFHDAGGFDTRFPRAAAEDRDLCDRLAAAGHPLFFEPDAIVVHHHGLSLSRFWRQHFNYGTGAWRFHQLRARRLSGKIQPEPLDFYWRMFRYPNATGHCRPLALGALLALSQVANAAGFFRERAKQDPL